VRRDAPQLGSWHGRLEALAGRAAASLHPEPNRSIGTILKIKTLAGGSAADSRYVDGVVCRLRLADKRMATRLPSPRILLLDCALEHEAGGVSTSLEGLGRQERDLGQSRAISGTLGTHEGLGQSRVISGDLGPSRAISGDLGSSRGSRAISGQSRVISGNLG